MAIRGAISELLLRDTLPTVNGAEQADANELFLAK